MSSTRGATTAPIAPVPVLTAAGADLIGTTPGAYPVRRRGVRSIPLRGGRWRVTRDSGAILGYVERVESGDGLRWQSSRMTTSARIQPLGDFATPEDALDVLRFV
jgi:hypothetical protein